MFRIDSKPMDFPGHKQRNISNKRLASTVLLLAQSTRFIVTERVRGSNLDPAFAGLSFYQLCKLHFILLNIFTVIVFD